MSEIQKITDYSFNLALLLEQYKKSDKLKGLIDSMNDQADDLESALFEIRDEFYLETAVGVQLDIIGIIFNVERNGKNDTEYRASIQSKSALFASGEPESIIAILLILFDATYVDYFPGYPSIPASFYVHTDAIISQEGLNIISPAGVQGLFLNNYLIDAVGNDIVDYNGDNIWVVAV